MNLLLQLMIDLMRTIACLTKPGGVKAVVAENLLLKQQLLLLNRPRKRGPNLSGLRRFILGALCQFIPRRRITRVAVALRPSTLFRIHRWFRDLKYRRLFSSKPRKKPGPKGPDAQLIEAVVEFKRRNPRCGYRRIAQQIASTFGIDLDKDEVRRILAAHYKPVSGSDGPSWLTFLGHCKDSLWSLDFFPAESIILQTHWIMVVMDQYSRRIIGFAVQPIAVDGQSLCRMFNQIIAGADLPRRLSFDYAPLFDFRQWAANLRILDIDPIRTVPHVPISHPFIERLIGTIRREYLDHLCFWNSTDLQSKLDSFQAYYNRIRVHQGIHGMIPDDKAANREARLANFGDHVWKSYCNRLFQMPIAA